jgi:hypothetical protein
MQEESSICLFARSRLLFLLSGIAGFLKRLADFTRDGGAKTIGEGNQDDHESESPVHLLEYFLDEVEFEVYA